MAKLWRVSFNDDERNIRRIFADTTAYLINKLLSEDWDSRETSLYERRAKEGTPKLELEPADSPKLYGRTPEQYRQKIETAEEFVCVQYIAFIHNIISRIRTMTTSMALLFVCLCFAVAFYPFAPRTLIATLLACNFAVIGLTVAYVYAGMDRDEILSLIAETDPGRLGGEFWVKLGGFLIGPVIGILATQYPALLDSVLGWLQPGLNVFK